MLEPPIAGLVTDHEAFIHHLSSQLKQPLVFSFHNATASLNADLCLKNTQRSTNGAEDTSASEHHLQQALAGSSVVNSLCK